jgi:hypothetical protein
VRRIGVNGTVARPERCRRIARDLALVLAEPTAEELADRTRLPRIVSVSVDPDVALEGSKVTVTIDVENCDYASVTFPGGDGPREFDGSGPMEFCALTTGLVTVVAVNALNPQVMATTPVWVEHIPRFDASALQLPEVPLLSGAQISALAHRFDTLYEEALNLHAVASDARSRFGSSDAALGVVATSAMHLEGLGETAVAAARARAVTLGCGSDWRADRPSTPRGPELPPWPPLTRGDHQAEPS